MEEEQSVMTIVLSYKLSEPCLLKYLGRLVRQRYPMIYYDKAPDHTTPMIRLGYCNVLTWLQFQAHETILQYGWEAKSEIR